MLSFPFSSKQKTLVFLLILCVSCVGKFKSIKGHRGFYVSSQEVALKMYQSRNQFYELKKHDTIVSIGAESGCNEVIYGLLTDSLNFILENISSKYLNPKEVDFSKSYYEKMFAKPTTANYTIQIGNDTSTLLPSSSCTKVMVENSLHEFSEPSKMIRELNRILKPGSDLYLFERLSTPKHPIHGACNKRLFSKDELLDLMSKEHFSFVKTEVFEGVNLFKFRKN